MAKTHNNIVLQFILKNIFQIGFFSLLFFILGTVFFNISYCKQNLFGKSTMGSSPVIDQEKISPGYTLISPVTIPNNDPKNTGTIYLIDNYGKTVHTWKTRYPVFFSRLTKNAHLIVTEILPVKNNQVISGLTGMISELDWNGNVIWEYQHPMLHHDFDILPNGNVIAMVWEKIPKETADNVLSKPVPSQTGEITWADEIIEITPKGKVVWTWHAYQHLSTADDINSNVTPIAVWGYANSLAYVEKNPLTNTEAFLISFRKLNTIALISKKTGDFIWRSPKQLLDHQHDASMTQNGTILTFDNNLSHTWSRVVEIDPKKNKIIWQFDAGTQYSEKSKLRAEILGGAERLANNNTLIVDGKTGHLFEVDTDGNLVWDYISPYSANQTGPWPNNFLFKARKYGSEIAWPQKLPDAAPLLSNTCSNLYDFF